jgi:hypothetical protein
MANLKMAAATAAVVVSAAVTLTGCNSYETTIKAAEKPALPKAAKWLQGPEVTTQVGTAERELPKATGDLRVEGEKSDVRMQPRSR